MNEAAFLAALRHLPLHPGADDLRDDTASIAGLTITTDTIVEGVHFLSDDPPEDVAWKLVAVNLSDLAAKGAEVEGVLLNYPLTDPLSSTPAKAGAQSGDAPTGPRPSPGWDQEFIEGLGAVLHAFGAKLIGGDTVSLPSGAPRVLTLTAIGRDAPAPPRSGARASDELWVTGTIGDAGAGLAIAQGMAGPPELLAAYRRPQPRLADGRALAPLVHAMMDVSDGLLIDALRIADASGLAVAIDLSLVPLSPGYRGFSGDVIAAVTAGDDYQLLFAAPPGFVPPVPATRIGGFAHGRGLTLTDGAMPVPLPDRLGFQH